MTDLAIKLTWEDPGLAKSPELRATWSQFSLTVGEESLTRVDDSRSKSVRDALYVPLYPLGEWIAHNWWRLLYEIPSTRRISAEDYASRHTLRSAREGYALPDIRFETDGAAIQIQWQPESLPECRLAFISGGTANVPIEQFKAELTSLLNTLVARLENQGIHDTPLQQEWLAIQQLDETESSFCRAAARLGIDPFDIDDQTAEAIVQAHETLPDDLLEEFLAVANAQQLSSQSTALREVIEELGKLEGDAGRLPLLRTAAVNGTTGDAPWQEGYHLARRVRAALNLGEKLWKTLDEILSSLDIGPASWDQLHLPLREGCNFIDGMIAVKDFDHPAFLIQKPRSDSQLFAFSRLLCEYFLATPAEAAVITASRSVRQKRSRAFAAEFLMPAHELQKRIGGMSITEEDLDELAEDLGVSALVVRHQIKNHRIAEILPAD